MSTVLALRARRRPPASARPATRRADAWLGRLATALACCALTSCNRAPAEDAFFPLQAGHQWTYRVTTRLGGDADSEQETLTLSTLGRETMPGLGGDPAWRRRSDGGLDYWLRADASGIYRVASKSDLQADSQADSPPRYVLKAPFSVGTQWQAPTTAYLLMRRNDFPREVRHSHPSIPMLYRIEAVDEPLSTPAGPLAHCLRVRGSAAVRLYVDPAAGWRDVPLVSLEWYCPGVGLARLERSELVRSAFLSGGTRTLELLAWE